MSPQTRAWQPRQVTSHFVQGDWVYGKRHGTGEYSYHDGGRYSGEWVDDKVGTISAACRLVQS
jgi:hypothetical protein|eukprot:COSAG01_NODE_1259_length_11009_cov_53.138930_2_plen_63_part_00